MQSKYIYLYNLVKRSCDNMINILEKGKEFMIEKSMDEKSIMETRLAPDMFPFVKQVQIFSDNAKGSVGRLMNVEIPKMDDVEMTFDELIERVKKTKNFLESLDVKNFEDAGTRKIKMGWMPEGMYFEGEEYMDNFVVQNMIFHLTTAYNILRQMGVSLGKQDFIGKMEMKSE